MLTWYIVVIIISRRTESIVLHAHVDLVTLEHYVRLISMSVNADSIFMQEMKVYVH